MRNQLALSRENEISYFYKFHAPSHLNAGNYIAGLMFGFVYLESKEKLMKINRTWKLEVAWHFCWITGYVVSMLGFPFIETDIAPTIWTALFGGFMKHYHGFLMGFLILGLVMRLGWIVPKIFNLPIFRILARIMYSYYLSHIFVLRLFLSGSNQPFEINGANMWAFTAAVYLFGNLLSVPLALTVEFPINSIAKETLDMIRKAEKHGKRKTANHLNLTQCGAQKI